MADNTLNTDVAKELNITARRNDTFQMQLEIRDSNNALIDFSAVADTSRRIYQAKMTIANTGGDKILSLYTEYWRDTAKDSTTSDPDGTSSGSYTHPDDVPPETTTQGHYTGSSTNPSIKLHAQTSSGKAIISVPYNYMDFQAGTYNYDLQIRKKESAASTVEYTTWLYGTFTLRSDITKLG